MEIDMCTPKWRIHTLVKVIYPKVVCMYSSLVDFNLRIKDLEAGDAGQYTCYVSTNGPTISVTHNLQILGTTHQIETFI